MRKGIAGAVIGLSMLLAGPQASYAGQGWNGGHGGHGWHGGHGGGGFRTSIFLGGGFYGPGFFWPRPWAPYYAYGSPYPYAYSPQVVGQSPPTFVQQEPEAASYWYYCQNPQGYYPYVPQCGSGWMQVVPPQGPPS